VNKNYETALHVDGNNMGPSYIVGLGDYDGGQVRVRGFGFGHSQPAALRCAALWIPRAAACGRQGCNMQRGTWRAACGAQRVDDALRCAALHRQVWIQSCAPSGGTLVDIKRSWMSMDGACSALTLPLSSLQRILLRACDPAVRRSTASAPFWERARPAQRRPLGG
jgi:hypothetical protein